MKRQTYEFVGWAEFTKPNATILPKTPQNKMCEAYVPTNVFAFNSFPSPRLGMHIHTPKLEGEAEHAHLELRFGRQHGHVGLRKLCPTYTGGGL